MNNIMPSPIRRSDCSTFLPNTVPVGGDADVCLSLCCSVSHVLCLLEVLHSWHYKNRGISGNVSEIIYPPCPLFPPPFLSLSFSLVLSLSLQALGSRQLPPNPEIRHWRNSLTISLLLLHWDGIRETRPTKRKKREGGIRFVSSLGNVWGYLGVFLWNLNCPNTLETDTVKLRKLAPFVHRNVLVLTECIWFYGCIES